MVVQSHVTHERLLQILTTGESMGFKHIGNAPIEALHHAIDSGRAWLGQAMSYVQGQAQLIKLMVARRNNSLVEFQPPIFQPSAN
jgi:hypothetical protein